MGRTGWKSAILRLFDKRLVCLRDDGDGEFLSLTDKGVQYMLVNPHLWNPVNWTKMTAWICLVTLIMQVFICFKLM